MSINAAKIALRVLAAFLSCFFSVLFLTAFGFLMLEIAKAVVANEGVLEAQCDSPDFSNCLGTNLASRGNGLISSNFDELFDVKTATFFSISGVVGTVRGYCAVELFTDFCRFCRHFEPRTCSESLRFMTDAKATGSWLVRPPAPMPAKLPQEPAAADGSCCIDVEYAAAF